MILKLTYAKAVQMDGLFSGPVKKFEVARARNKFLSLLNDDLKYREEERQRLIKKHAVKEKDGKPKVDGTKYVFKNPKEWDKDIKALDDAEFTIDISPATKRDVIPHLFTIIEELKQEVETRCTEAGYTVGDVTFLEILEEIKATLKSIK